MIAKFPLDTVETLIMKRILPIVTVLIVALTSSVATAQNNNNNNENENVSDQNLNQRFWEANLPGGDYMVSLSRISSISNSTYNIKGIVVHEVTIETMGAALARFYALEAIGESNGSNIASNITNRLKDVANEGAEKVGTNVDTTVTKEYPVTTHQKTIEFRVVDKADLDEIYKSLSRAWRDNRGRKITIK